MIGIKVMVIALIGTLLSLMLKEQKAYLGISLGMICTMCIFFLGLPYLEKIVSYVRVLYSAFDRADGYMSVLLKITGIAAISAMTSNLCTDAGMTSVSSVVGFCGKIICVSLTLPVISDFFYELLGVLP